MDGGPFGAPRVHRKAVLGVALDVPERSQDEDLRLAATWGGPGVRPGEVEVLRHVDVVDGVVGRGASRG